MSTFRNWCVLPCLSLALAAKAIAQAPSASGDRISVAVDAAKTGAGEDVEAQEIDELVRARDAARKARNWAEADRIRNVLTERNIVVEDRSGVSIWHRK